MFSIKRIVIIFKNRSKRSNPPGGRNLFKKWWSKAFQSECLISPVQTAPNSDVTPSPKDRDKADHGAVSSGSDRVQIKLLFYKAKSIAIGWYKRIFKPMSAMGKYRYGYCKDCEFKKGPVCGVCYCVLKAKVEVEDEKCPEGKWGGETSSNL